MNPFKFSILILTVFMVAILAVACSDDEPGEWEPVPDDDDDDASTDDDDDADGCDCEVSEEQWQALLDECSSVVGAVYQMFDDPTATNLCEACDPCLVGCFQDHDYCTTPFVDCFWACAGK